MKIKYHENTAIYGNEDKTVILVRATENTGTREADFDRVVLVQPSEVFDTFVKQVSLEKVEENTQRYLNDLQQKEDQRNDALIERVKKEIGGDIIATDAPKGGSFDPNAMEADDLFKLKLQSFEIEEVKSSKNRALKARIRKANNFMEVVSFTAATILDTLNEQSSE